MKRVFLIAFLTALAGHSASAEGIVRASCHEGGRIVYREDFPASAPSEKRILIAAQNPNAMCVFLDIDTDPKFPIEANEPYSDQASLPPDILSAAAGNGRVDDEGLATALSIIEQGRPGDRYPQSITGAFAPKESKPAIASSDLKMSKLSGRYVNLTVGIYKAMPLADVMAHWKLMKTGSKVLSRMTPTVNRLDGVTVVSVDRVPDELAVTLCDEAKKLGPGCLAIY